MKDPLDMPSYPCVGLQEQCGSYTFIPYVVSPQGKVFACDARMMTCMKELMQPSFQLEPLLTPLVERLAHLLSSVQVQSRSAKIIVCSRQISQASIGDGELIVTPPLFFAVASTSGSPSGRRSEWPGSVSAGRI